MKRLLVLLPLLILLAGCSEEKPQQTQPQTQPVTQTATQSQPETKPVVNRNALVSAELSGENLGVLSMGADLLLFGEDSLSIVDAKTLEIVLTERIPGVPLPDSGLVWTHTDGVAYFDAANKFIVFLGTNLKETMRLQMPEDMVGTACLATDWNTVYYCTASEIRALDMKKGVSRLVMARQAINQSVSSVLLDGAVLNCVEQTESGRKTVLISSQTGEILYDGMFLTNMVGSGTRYYLTIDHKSVEEIIFGDVEGEPQNFWPKQTPDGYQILPERNAVITACADSTGVILDYYDLTNGRHAASICIENQQSVTAFAAEADGGVWILCGKTIYLWNPGASRTEDETIYTMPRITRETPDTDGLAKVKKTAKKLARQFDVKWLLADDAWQVAPWDYTFETEYIPRAFEDALSALQKTMSQFPENFFTLAAQRSNSKKLTVVLVREIKGAPEKGTLATNGCIQYRLDGDLYVALRMDADLERNFYHAMGHLIDTRVLSTGTAFYEWEKLNPPDFAYDNDYIANQNRNADEYLRDSDRWFIDTFSMSFPVEDRSRIFEFACLPGNDGYFVSTIMKQKLKRVCEGIRKSFALENDERQFLWEQYLQ